MKAIESIRKYVTLRNIIIVAAIILVIVFAFVVKRWISARNTNKRKAQIEKNCSKTKFENTIFVSVASYRDPDCAKTVFDCFNKAYCPHRIHVGVCQQNYPIDYEVLDMYRKLSKRVDSVGNFEKNIRIFSINASQAKGPMYARALIEKNLYKGEKYYLVIDSHTQFVQDWDKIAISSLEWCRKHLSNKPILTMYPADFNSYEHLLPTQSSAVLQPPSYLRFKRWHKHHRMLEMEGPQMKKSPPNKHCFPSLFWAGGFSFTYGSVISQVPFDPTLDYTFIGEEASMAARLYTHGWDFFSPWCMLVFHKWKRRRPTFWEQFYGPSEEHKNRRKQEEESYNRLHRLLSGQAAATPYGLGPVRSLRDYENYCGVSFQNNTVEPHAILGISRGATADEILCKFGSMIKYHSLLKKVTNE